MKTIEKSTVIGEILQFAPQAAPMFLSIGMPRLLGRDGRRGLYGAWR